MGAKDVEDLDALIVGTGFSGVYLLYNLRKLGYHVKAIDSASELGGVWANNTYPGSRVDIEVPTYELNIEELWNHPNGGWTWSERFPGQEELLAYFRFVERRLDLSKDVDFNTWVDSANWNEDEKKWYVKSKDGRQWKTTFFLPCVGYAAKPYIPPFKGLESFGGQWTHTAKWPKDGIDLQDKRVGIIGTGASAVQVIQTIAPVVKSLKVFQQTPATAIPMQQRKLKPEESTKSSVESKREFFEHRKTQWDGSRGAMIPRMAKDDPPEQREVEFTRLWNDGGFSFWSSNYIDLFGVKESNDIVYDFWKRQVHSRVKDPSKQEILAPNTSPYAFGTKRVPLEQTYYDVFNLDHVSVINLRQDPILEINPEGLKLTSGQLHTLDVLIIATGFDMSTGSLTQVDIHGVDGQSLSEKWFAETKTYLGMAVHGFPNMFFPYGPQSPSNTCNGPLCAELQGQWIIDCVEWLRTQGKTRVEAESTAEDEWSEHATGLLKGSLFEQTNSYYFADNIPRHGAKKREPLFYFGGVPLYMGRCQEIAGDGYKGFLTV